MKKAYSKPQIYFDSFELSQSIAAGCEVIGNMAPGTCAYIDEETGLSVFVDSISACADLPQPGTPSDAMFGGLCYEIPGEAWNIFSS